MANKVLFVFTILFSLSLSAQNLKTNLLLDKMSQVNDNEFIRVRLEFKDNIDCFYLNQEFKSNNTPLNERARTIISSLKTQAKYSQNEVLEQLQHSDFVKNIKPFWIVNIVVLEIKKSEIYRLEQFEDIALIDLEENKYHPTGEIIQGEQNVAKSVNGTEPGLEAINVRPLWNLGYTGRGRLVYDYDTGVWPTHPSFSDRFLANNYPMEQCWFGYFSDVPTGVISSHGTHTLGTMAGLDRNTNDTIGVAFNAYWIANDFVTSTVEALPPITNMIEAFEWALNPDGDVNTTDDIPDIINNSWRWYDGNDTLHCGGYIVNLMNAIEAVGIANVFSGGNSGPTNTTVNSPQRINTTEVNTFCVGAVNGNASFPYPIADFSTRGPSQCEGTGSLLIHPEVVAPGVNVRSAWGTDGYISISGTSMSAPHVSGALLLLKEAFPNVSGEELLWAIYNTAIDMGDIGEDNVFGNGLIDAYAAFQELSLTHIPMNPNNVTADLGIRLLSPNRGALLCDNQLAIEIELMNLGSDAITNATISYEVEGQNYTYDWSGNLAFGASETIALPNITLTNYGRIEIQIDASTPDLATEYDVHNNHIHFNVNHTGNSDYPFTETFENGIDASKWFVRNIDEQLTWDTTSTVSRHGNHSSYMDLRDYNPRNGQKDQLTSGLIALPNSGNIYLSYDFAYQKYHTSAVFQDSFNVYISTDCGETFNNVKHTFANEMATIEENSFANEFVPSEINHWKRDSIDLSGYLGEEILIRFETVNSNGNNLYIDNISIYENFDPLNINEIILEELTIYPNPTKNELNISFNGKNKLEIAIIDLNGRLLKKETVSNGAIVDISQFNAGIYFVKAGGFKIEKIVKH